MMAFDKNIYISRRNELLRRMQGEKGIAVFIGNVNSPAQYLDNCYKWRQDSTWLYFFGIDEPGFAAIIDLESGNTTIYADDFTLDDIIWMGEMPTVKDLAAEAGVCCTASSEDFESDVSAAVRQVRQVHFVPVSRYYQALKLSGLLGISPSDCFKTGKDICSAASRSLANSIIDMRLVKQPEEIAEIDKVAELGYEMHTIGRKGIRPERIEQDIVGEMEGYTLAKGWGVSFSTILTQHGEIFHCHSHANAVRPGSLMVIDAGVESNSHYASDHTRTYPTSGVFSRKQRDIYSIVYACNELAFSLTKPGTAYYDIHLAVSGMMLEELKGLGLLRGSVDDMLAEGVCGLFLPHGLGHNIGLDVHDMEDYGENLVGYESWQRRSGQLGLGSLRMARPLKEGNFISDEPGIYFIPALIESWKREGKAKDFVNYDKLETYYDFGGIRLEDDVLVTADGARRAGSRRLPISPDDVEKAMKED